MRKIVSLFVAAALALVACTSGGTGSSGGSKPAPKASFCVPESGSCGAGHGPTNGGVGRVSGICRFSVKSTLPDTTADSGLKPKRVSDTLVYVAGVVWGSCTDTVNDFVIDLHVYAAPAGDGSGNFTKDPKAHEVGHSENSTAPGPSLTPFAVLAPCVPGLEYQLVWYITATDSAGNFIGGGPYGGRSRQFTAQECGLAG